jgi:hypothetical protein
VPLLDELLTQFGLAPPAHEQPGEHHERDDAALGEHDQAADALIVERVVGVERAV